jgi:hypothetical protein
MKKIQVEPALSKKLTEANGEVLLHDAEGRALGFFSPLKEYHKIEEFEPMRSMEEIDALRKSYAGKRPEEIGKPLEQILGGSEKISRRGADAQRSDC